jgi:hypothetical protein
VLTSGSPSASQIELTLRSVAPGGYGEHPRVEYGVTACGERPFRGVLLLGGEARLRGLHPVTFPSPRSDDVLRAPQDGSIALARNLPYEDASSVIHGHLGPVQVIQISLPAATCLPPPLAPRGQRGFSGTFAAVQGRLEGAPHRSSFAPLGLAPVRQTQSWPMLGSLQAGYDTRSKFHFGPLLPGSWSRPLRSYFHLGIGDPDAKESVDFSRPTVLRDAGLNWIETKPFAATARVTNLDNQAKWQTLMLAATIWFGIGGSVVAALVFELMRPRRTRAAPDPPSATTAEPARPATVLELLTVALLTLAVRRRRDRP